MKRTAVLACLLVVAGCGGEPEPPAAPESENGSLQRRGAVDLLPQRVRARRRVDIDQLDATFKQLMGGMSWSTAGATEEGDRYKALAGALGVPDYKRTTHEDLAASILFAKFLEDAAVSVCNRRVDADYAGSARDRIIVGDEDGSYTKLGELLLLFHGNARPSNDELTIWSGLFFAARARASQGGATMTQAGAAGWKAVCVGLVEHPDFTTY